MVTTPLLDHVREIARQPRFLRFSGASGFHRGEGKGREGKGRCPRGICAPLPLLDSSASPSMSSLFGHRRRPEETSPPPPSPHAAPPGNAGGGWLANIVYGAGKLVSSVFGSDSASSSSYGCSLEEETDGNSSKLSFFFSFSFLQQKKLY